MPIEILMPALSPTMTEGNLVKWLKKEGDSIKSGTVIAEIETDKATMEVEAVDEGKLAKILIPEGTEGVKVNQAIAIILEEGEDASALEKMTSRVPAPTVTPAETPLKQEAPAAVISAQSPKDQGRTFASPLAKRLAQDNAINLSSVKGTGPHGRIVKTDVEQALTKASSGSTPVLPGNIQRGPLGEPPYEVQSLNNMRKVIAQRLTQAKQTIPHFYLTIDVNLDKLMNLRAEINDRMEDQKLSVNDFIVRACALSLIDVPEANASWQGDSLYLYKTADVSVAVAIDGGLITPVVKSAEHKSLKQISSEVRDLAKRARDGKLAPEEFQGGTFTLSNLGMYGISQFDAILNPPQACILAVGKGEKRAIVLDDQIKSAMMMTCTLSVDHRAVDGAVGSNFLKAFKTYMEDPLRLLL